MGERFYCKTLPDLIRQLERLNTVLERLAEQQERPSPTAAVRSQGPSR